MSGLSIGEVARRAGITPSAIRHYERVGLLPSAPQVSGGRQYGEQAITRLGVIRLAEEAGFTLAEIRTFLADIPPDAAPGERWQAATERKIEEIDALIARAEARRRLLTVLQGSRCDSIEGCVAAQAQAALAMQSRGSSMNGCGLVVSGAWSGDNKQRWRSVLFYPRERNVQKG